MSSTRQKTQEELDQEERDAALARQLQQADDAPAAAAHGHTAEQPAQKPTVRNGVVSIGCPACTFINEVSKPVAGTKYGCKQCRTPLPIPTEMLGAPQQGGGNGKIVKCDACGMSNRVAPVHADAFLCGRCHRRLATGVAPGSGPTSPGAAAPASQGAAEQRTIQVRCGQCSAVNALQVTTDATTVQFECGNCATVNEAGL